MAQEKNTTESKEAVVDNVIQTPQTTRDTPTLGFGPDGVMGSTTTNADKPKVDKVEMSEVTAITKVAIFSLRNIYAEGFGKINVGYNIVPKKYADFWLNQRGVRLATPEEVAEAFA